MIGLLRQIRLHFVASLSFFVITLLVSFDLELGMYGECDLIPVKWLLKA